MRSVLEKSCLDTVCCPFLEPLDGDVVIRRRGEAWEGFAALMQDQSLSYFGYTRRLWRRSTVAAPPPLPTMLLDTGPTAQPAW